MNNPAWQAIIPELVPRELIPDTVALNAASNNLARAVGPALGGLMVAAFQRIYTGAGSVFLLNAALLCRRHLGARQLEAHAALQIRSPLRAHRRLHPLRPALHPLRTRRPRLAHPRLHLYLLRLGHLVAARRRRPPRPPSGSARLRHPQRLARPRCADRSHARFRASAAAFPPTASSPSRPRYIVASLLILAFVHLPADHHPQPHPLRLRVDQHHVQPQHLRPTRRPTLGTGPRARHLSHDLPGRPRARLRPLGSSSPIRFSTTISLTTAACGLALSFPFTRRFHILQGPVPDHTPYQWKRPAPQPIPFPTLDSEPADDLNSAGPVRISVDYRVPAENYAEFTQAIHQLRGVRLRDGAIRWGIYRDATDPEHLNETFVMESWLDYLRSRERVTAADEEIRDRVRSLHRDDEPPRATYQIYAKEITNGS